MEPSHRPIQNFNKSNIVPVKELSPIRKQILIAWHHMEPCASSCMEPCPIGPIESKVLYGNKFYMKPGTKWSRVPYFVERPIYRAYFNYLTTGLNPSRAQISHSSFGSLIVQ